MGDIPYSRIRLILLRRTPAEVVGALEICVLPRVAKPDITPIVRRIPLEPAAGTLRFVQ